MGWGGSSRRRARYIGRIQPPLSLWELWWFSSLQWSDLAVIEEEPPLRQPQVPLALGSGAEPNKPGVPRLPAQFSFLVLNPYFHRIGTPLSPIKYIPREMDSLNAYTCEQRNTLCDASIPSQFFLFFPICYSQNRSGQSVDWPELIAPQWQTQLSPHSLRILSSLPCYSS